LLDYINICD